jgi:hypothetical protein
MPIFMDRHDVPGSTAEDVAEAHRKDVEIQDKYGVRYMTYWHDAERGTGFASLTRLMPRLQLTSTVKRMAKSRQTSFRLI